VLATGKVIGEDPARDLALVQTSRPIAGYRLPLASRSPRLAEQVVALGYPFGLPLTVTQGSVSGLGRSIPIANVTRRQLVQTDAALNPGNSGGPLLATDTGDVVGLVDLGSEANGTSFAVSAEVAKPLLQAWRAAPQPVPADTCGGLALGGTGATSPSSAPSSGRVGYVDEVGRLLGNSAAVRKQLVAAVSEASSNPVAARQTIAAVVAARRDEMSIAQSMSVPSEAANVQAQLIQALSLSLASDRLYQRWIASGSQASLSQAQANDVQAVSVKRSFLRLYNRLRLAVGRPPVPQNFPF
jgi:S1-C subfamily serine protease